MKTSNIGILVRAMKEGVREYTDLKWRYASQKYFVEQTKHDILDSEFPEDREYYKYKLVGFADSASKNGNVSLATEAYDAAGCSQTKHVKRYIKQAKIYAKAYDKYCHRETPEDKWYREHPSYSRDDSNYKDYVLGII